MKIFAEILEIPSKENKIFQFFKIEVGNKQEALDKINQTILKSPWLSLNYEKRIHYCNHSEQGEPNQPCLVKNL